jgi:hypothetical protein
MESHSPTAEIHAPAAETRSPAATSTDTAAPIDQARKKPTTPEFIECTPQIRVDRARGVIECAVVSVLDVGFLEQYVCSPSTREHEALFVFEGKASELHAALLLAGFTPGTPGSWRELPPEPKEGAAGDDADRGRAGGNARNPDQRFTAVPPTGDTVAITVVMPDGVERDLAYFVRLSPLSPPSDARPPSAFVFAGSRFRTDRRTGVERYVADGSGSVVGLVTFGDETIAAIDVVPDQAEVAQPVWEVFTERMPKPGTRLMLRLTHGARRSAPRRRTVAANLGARAGVCRNAGWAEGAPPNPYRIGRQIKRPGRGGASGRALPGANEEVGKRLPLAGYGVDRRGQAAPLRNHGRDIRNRRYRTESSPTISNHKPHQGKGLHRSALLKGELRPSNHFPERQPSQPTPAQPARGLRWNFDAAGMRGCRSSVPS